MFSEVQKQLVELRRRQTLHETDRLKKNYDRLPRNVDYITRSEVEFRKMLSIAIEDCEDARESL